MAPLRRLAAALVLALLLADSTVDARRQKPGEKQAKQGKKAAKLKSADAMVPEIYPCDPAAEPYTRCSAEEITFIEKITAAIGAEPAEASSQAPPSPQLDFPRPCP